MTYQTIFLNNASEFLEHTLEHLAKNETRNNLMLGLALRLKDDPHAYTEHDPLMTIVSDEHGIISAMAIMTPPFPVIVESDPLNNDALEELARALISAGWRLSGVNGVVEASDAFARIWEKYTAQVPRLQTRLRAYELRKVEELDYPEGEVRIAEERDAPKAAEFLNAMMDELDLLGTRSTPERALVNIRQRRTFFWEVDGEQVSSTVANREQIKSICISGVYTPPQHRRKGYARALVAEVSKEMLSRGFELTNLFTDLANPTSNKIYQEVGYQPVCDYHQYLFETS
ncbi:MAG: GNAT family N-acetyltransferase [Anaerolineaceae bacterium]|nr:GNAT family N-acetyltransferase [Anaerolineaceae bacterium]MDD4043154.1 GNAT family N-acetyltransferase [Anaerolineaceae bacterium]MDD4577624.1 GNAT family N-acetyltransferase [Anaerolineaceae bacterium]